MAIHLSAPRATELKPRIVVIGVGGAGGNAVNHMIVAGLQGVEFIAANTDAQALTLDKAQIRSSSAPSAAWARGRKPEVGRSAAEERTADDRRASRGRAHGVHHRRHGRRHRHGRCTDHCQGGAERGILTVGVVTKPFMFEAPPPSLLIEVALAQAEPLLHNHQVNIQIPDELPIVRVDGRAVTEVIYTLLDNARKYAPPHTQITISARTASDDVIEISVEDQGAGIPRQYRERVFERFYRIGDNGLAKGHPTGFGVGLAIAKGIVEAHGGRIWIEDAKTGRGARIVFTVPVADTEEIVPSPAGKG